jgi:hypothetical protein
LAHVRRSLHSSEVAERKRKHTKREPPKKRLDPRTRHVEVTGRDGVELAESQRWETIQPMKLDTGKLVYFAAPFAWVLLLQLAVDHLKRGEKARRRALASAAPFNVGDVLEDQVSSHDALGYLTAAVVLSFAAIEAYANEQIDNLAENATLTVGGKEIARDDMARNLSTNEKLKKAVPLAKSRPSIAGDSTLWQKFTDLKHLRDELVHLKERGYSPDPDETTAYAHLLRGDAADCAADAATLIYEMEGKKWPDGSGHLVPNLVADA